MRELHRRAYARTRSTGRKAPPVLFCGKCRGDQMREHGCMGCRGMARYRYECQRKWDRAMQTGVAAEFAVAKDDADISSVIGTRSILDFDRPEQCYAFHFQTQSSSRRGVGGRPRATRNCETVVWSVRLEVGSVRDASLYAASAERIDAGSSYMILSDAVQAAVECHESIEALGSFFVDHVQTGHEAALHRTLHHRFGVDWMVKLRVSFESLKLLHACNMRGASRDLLCLASRLFEKIKSVRASSQTICAFSEKLNAGISMGLLIQEARAGEVA